MSTLTGKTALVTGGSRGIGRAIAERLGVEGARVGVHYGTDETAARETVATITAAGGQAFALRVELGVAGDADALWEAFGRHADGVDILVNNAGVGDVRAPIGDVTARDLDRLFAINTRAVFFVTQRALPLLRDGGRIVMVSSSVTRGFAVPELVAYAMSKAPLDALTAALAKELGARGITVNAVAPGVVDTAMNAGWLGHDAARAAISAMSPLGRVAEPSDVGDIVAFLASDDSRWITGQWIDATGGAQL